MNRILLVEDNEMNRDMLSRRLQRRGFDVTVAVDGQAGIDAAELQLPDLILMDMSMPLMNGWDATRLVKKNPNTKHIPIMALTAHAMDEERERAMAAGCDEYDTKPIQLDRLIGKIESLIGKST